MNQSREAHHPARPLHSPDAPCTNRHPTAIKAWF
jgi:hypothetical protein